MINQFIQCGGRQFVILGAGFDTQYFTLKVKRVVESLILQSSGTLPSFKYFELDFAKVVKQKAQFIGRSKECQALLTDWTEKGEAKKENEFLTS